MFWSKTGPAMFRASPGLQKKKLENELTQTSFSILVRFAFGFSKEYLFYCIIHPYILFLNVKDLYTKIVPKLITNDKYSKR